MGKILLCLLVVLCAASSSFALDPGSYGAFVREHYTYRKGLEVLNSPAGRLSIAGAAQLLPAAAAATGVTLSAGVTLPLAAMVMGTAWLAQDVYDRQHILSDPGKPGQYVQVGDSPGPQDFVCTPVHITQEIETVTPQSFPSATSQLVGRPAYASQPVGDFVRSIFSSQDSDPSVQALKNLVNENSEEPPHIPVSEPLTGNFLRLSDDRLVRITSDFFNSMNYPRETWDSYMLANGGISVAGYTGGYFQGGRIWVITGEFSSLVNGQEYYKVYNCPAVLDQNGTPLPEPEPETDWAGFKNGLQTLLQTANNALAKITQEAAETNPEQVAVTDDVPAPASPAPMVQTGPISQTELNNFYTTNANNVTNYATTQTTSTSTTQEIAQNQIAVDAAKQAAPEFPDSATFHGDAALPDANDYSFELEEVPEQNLVERIHGLIDQGLPVLSVMQSSGLTASGDPSISAEIYGRDITVDFSDYAAIFHTMGIMLTFCSVVLSYRIVVGS